MSKVAQQALDSKTARVGPPFGSSIEKTDNLTPSIAHATPLAWTYIKCGLYGACVIQNLYKTAAAGMVLPCLLIENWEYPVRPLNNEIRFAVAESEPRLR